MMSEKSIEIEKAIEVLINEMPHCGKKLIYTEEERTEAFELAIKALNILADKEYYSHSTAHWEYDENALDYGIPGWRCSNCKLINSMVPTYVRYGENNYKLILNPNGWDRGQYCPACGFKMITDKKEEDKNENENH